MKFPSSQITIEGTTVEITPRMSAKITEGAERARMSQAGLAGLALRVGLARLLCELDAEAETQKVIPLHGRPVLVS